MRITFYPKQSDLEYGTGSLVVFNSGNLSQDYFSVTSTLVPEPGFLALLAVAGFIQKVTWEIERSKCKPKAETPTVERHSVDQRRRSREQTPEFCTKSAHDNNIRPLSHGACCRNWFGDNYYQQCSSWATANILGNRIRNVAGRAYPCKCFPNVSAAFSDG